VLKRGPRAEKLWVFMPWSSGLERQLEFDVDTVIFALTQEGCLTHRLMSSVR
jgi:hypothetical protein